MVAYCFVFFSFKKSTKAKTKGITDTDLSQEKTQDQRKLFLDVISFSPPAEKTAAIVYGPSFSLSFKPCLFPEPDFCFFIFIFFRELGGWWLGLGKRECGVLRPLWFEEQDPALSSHHMTRKKDRLKKKRTSKEEDAYRKNGGFGSWWSNPPQILTPTFQQQKHIEHFKGRSHNISQLDPF